MKIKIQCSSDASVHFANPQWIVDPKLGLWRINLTRLAHFLNDHLEELSFGESITTFYFGFELVVPGEFWRQMANYVSYRPKMKTIISVGQVDWPAVKYLNGSEQLSHLFQALELAIVRVATMKRKPRSFDSQAFLKSVREIIPTCSVDDVLDQERKA